MTLKMKTSSHFSMGNRTLIHVDLLAMNVSWTTKDLKLFENEFDFLVSMVCTIARFITFVMAIVVHRAFYRLMKRLPGRAVNQVIYPYMVSKSIIIKKYLLRGEYNVENLKLSRRCHKSCKTHPEEVSCQKNVGKRDFFSILF